MIRSVIPYLRVLVLAITTMFVGACFFGKENDSTPTHMGLELRRLDSLHFSLDRMMPIEGNFFPLKEGTLSLNLSDPAGNLYPIQVEAQPDHETYKPFLLPEDSAYNADDWYLVAEVQDESGFIISDTLKPCCRFDLH